METISRATIRLLMPNELILFLKKHKALSQYIDEVWAYYNNSVSHHYTIAEKIEMLKKRLTNGNSQISAFYWNDSVKGHNYWIKLYNLYEKERTCELTKKRCCQLVNLL